MKVLLLYLLSLSFSSLAPCAEILAWKTPLSIVAPDGLSVPGVVRLERAPEASPFFGESDEIWNIDSLMPRMDDPAGAAPDWLVWNGTSGRVVAKGSWISMLRVRQHFNLERPPVQCRVKVGAHPIGADGAQPDPSKPASHSLSFVTRNGRKSTGSHAEGDASITSDAEALWHEDDSRISINLIASVSVAGFSKLEIDTKVVLKDRSPLWIARDFDGKQGIDILVTATLELLDGNPLHELILRQEGEIATPFSFSRMSSGSGSMVMGEGRRLAWSMVSLDHLIMVADGPEPVDEIDPFSAVLTERGFPIIDSRKFKETQVTEALAPHFEGTVFDIGELVKSWGIRISGDDFAGYDLKTFRAFIHSSDIQSINEFELLFSSEKRRALLIVITSRGNGEVKLLSLNGARSSSRSTHPTSGHTRNFEIEPVMDESDTYVDLRFDYSDVFEGKSEVSLNSSVTVESGEFLKVLEKENADGSVTLIELRAEKLEILD